MGRGGAELSRDLACGQFIVGLARLGDADFIDGIVCRDALCMLSSVGLTMVSMYGAIYELHSLVLLKGKKIRGLKKKN